ncbi:ankyrin repeat domain-containing protein 11 [Cocos nucifera]|uniref:Ankyrin repeat domain-containing protein 11 n=1 Tax=Cocos nucifera TaxID=13894 RepID=A0A8K0HY19_COCNU|nr:ankyrin repeat domain-containing protein 11 [Cocos nucifera]
MPRSSGNKSHGEDNYGERSDSQEDRNSRDRKERVEERGGSSRISRDQESEKRKSSSLPRSSQGKNQSGAGHGNVSVELGRKRKDRAEDSGACARWKGDREDDGVADSGPKGEKVGPSESKKDAKSKLSAVDSRERSSRRREGYTERCEDSSSKVESTKRRSEKDLSRDVSLRESSSQYKDAKEKGRERGLERDKKDHESRHGRSDDAGSRNQGSKTGCSEEERVLKKDKEITGWQIQDELRNAELEKELEKCIRRRGDGSGDRDKSQGDDRDGNNKRLSSRHDCSKNENYDDERHRDERHKDGRYQGKYREDLDRDQRHRDDRHRDQHSSRDHTSDRSDSKHHRDENKTSKSRYKERKLQDNDHGGSYVEDRSSRYKDSWGRKRSIDENDACTDLRPRSAKESFGDCDRARPEYFHSNKIDSNQSNKRPKSSSSSSVHAIKDQSRHSSRQAESTHQGLPSGDRDRPSVASMGDLAGVLRGCDGTSDSRSLKKAKTKDHMNSGDYLVETSLQDDKIRRSDGRSQSIQLMEISQSTNDHQFLCRGGTRRSLDIEDVANKGSSYKDKKEYSTIDSRERELPSKNLIMDNYSQIESNEHVPLGPSSFNRSGHFPPLPPVRRGVDSPLLLGSYEDDNSTQIGDHISGSRYRRNSDLSTGKGQGNAWKSAPTWPSPVNNGFVPFQHGLMPPGFPSAMRQFPVPSLFGMRPSRDATHDSVSYHMHGAAGHVGPFGWHNPMEDSCAQLQGWDGSSGVLGDDSHVYGRQEWDHQNGYLMGSRGWGMSAAMWKRQNENVNVEIPQPQEPDYSSHSLPDKGWTRQSDNQSCRERVLSESTEIKRPDDAPPAKNAAEAPSKTIYKKTPCRSKTAGDDCSHFCCNYLSKLDVSVDLASPELYEQCLTLLGTSDPVVCNISKHGYHQNIDDDNKVVKKRPNNILSSLFPANTEAVFQRAMSLYKRHHKAAKAMFPVVTDPSRGEKGSPEASDTDKVKVVDDQLPEELLSANVNSCRSTEEGSNYITEAEDNVPSDAKQQQDTDENVPGDADAQGDLSGDAKDQHSDVISDAVVFGEGSQACAFIMPECRVNLSRIPISPESTH